MLGLFISRKNKYENMKIGRIATKTIRL